MSFKCNGSTTEEDAIGGTYQTVYRGGFVTLETRVSREGSEGSEWKGLTLLSYSLGMCLSLIATMFLFAYLYSRTDPLNKFLKLLFLGASLLSGITSLAFQTDLISDRTNLVDLTSVAGVGDTYGMAIWIFRIVIVVTLLWLVWAGAHAVLGNKKGGMEGGGI